MKKEKKRNIIYFKNSMERSISKFNQILFDQQEAIAEMNITLKKTDKILLCKVENYLKLQSKFLGSVFINAKDKMKLTIKTMEEIAENVKKKRDQTSLKKIRKQLS